VPSKDRGQQEWLLPFLNPLKKNLSDEFFKELPRTPGVYIMLGAADSVLYVGKAKNLRARLRSYRCAHPDRVSRKVIRLLHLVREIRIELCATEKDALLRDNALIREKKPSFNVVNTSPESYYFIGLRELDVVPGEGALVHLRFRLTCSPKREGERLYGAFKGRRTLRQGYQALLRLLWVTQNEAERFEYPTRLSRRQPPYLYSLRFRASLLAPLKRFLNGTGDELLRLLMEELLGNERVPPFYYAVIQQDLEALTLVYRLCFERNRQLMRGQGLRRRIIGQTELDDLRVLELARLGKIGG
jgi:excinuclease UvrABC nuclease subunit